MKRDTLRTVDDVIDAFGGNTAVGEWLGIGASAVSNWRERRSIPPGWHLRLYLEAQAQGHRIDPKLFGLDIWPPLRVPTRSRHVT